MNKFKLTIIICMFFSIISISKVYALVNSYNLLGRTIYIDPGHGGRDSGTTYKNIYEKDINLTMSKKIEKYLVAKGATVYLTRESDVDLSTTTNNKKRSDFTSYTQSTKVSLKHLTAHTQDKSIVKKLLVETNGIELQQLS